jgi:signal transduction histidine kinase
LGDLREVLGVLRAPEVRLDPPPGLAGLAALVEQSRLAGIPVVRRDEGDVRPLPEAVQRATYRIVQEALTNVRKHAGDAATRVGLRYGPDSVEIEVRNAAGSAGPGDAVPGSGLGLAGLRERVELLGGEFTATSEADGGFAVRARIPLAIP